MRLAWVNDKFIDKEFQTPFFVEKDSDYFSALKEKYELFYDRAKAAGADRVSLHIIDQYRNDMHEALESYYKSNIGKCYSIIENLVRTTTGSLAVSPLEESRAFPGANDRELQLFRARIGNPASAFQAKDMLHLPKRMRAKTGNYRFSIPGNPSLYLANSSYGCWIEMGCPADNDFNVSPVLLDGEQRIFNLAVYIRDFSCLNEFEADRVHGWLKLLMLSFACSYRIKEEGRIFKSEYIISQAIMIACKNLGYDGVAYYSVRVSDSAFARCAVNLALFVNYGDEGEYSSLVDHMKMANPTNYALYKQLLPSLKYKDYVLRSTNHPFITNIGEYERQHPYRETEFYAFDRYLFSEWSALRKEERDESWGVPIS